MPNDLTICIPYGNYHADVVMEAIASAEAQTVPCNIIVMADPNSNGAGYARNRALEQVKSAYVTFLDADDVLDPRFAAVCMKAFDDYATLDNPIPRYVYTDWVGANNIAHQPPAPSRAWVWGEQDVHLVTAVIPTDRARLIGGFDENMAGLEDVDFYIRLRLSGVCGIHVMNMPLVYYREGGQRSVQARQSGAELVAFQYMSERYGGYNLMGCCGDTKPGPTGPDNEPETGDVLAQALWHGNRVERGRATGRLYPRTSFPKLMYVAEADVNAAPQHWKRVTSPTQAANGIILQPAYAPQATPWQDIANAMADVAQVRPAPSQPIQYKPNRTTVTKKQAAEWVKIEGNDL